MSEATFNLSDLGYDAEAARSYRSKKLANNVAGQWIISKAELTNSKASGAPMLVTTWNVFANVGDSSKVENANYKHYQILPNKAQDREARGRSTAQAQSFVQKLGLVAGRPEKGSKDEAAWNAYNAATEKAFGAVLADVSSLEGKTALAKFSYRTDASGDYVLDNAGYRQKNFTIYGGEFPADVTATPADKIWE